MATLAQIYDWFMTGKKPSQAQFWASWGSFWNKGESIPQSAISNLSSTLNAKAEKSQVYGHFTDENAHAELFGAKVDKEEGKTLSTNDYTTGEKALVATIVNKADTTAVESLITQLIGGAPEDANTLKELSDKVIAINAIIGGSTADGDSIVNTVKELLAAFATFPEGVDIVNLLGGKVNATDIYNALDSIVSGKVLDSRQGKVLMDAIVALQTNKVDKVAGERLINAGEITKLAGLTNITTTVKTIVSTALATQDVAGFVTYINALAVVLVVGANEIVEYKTSDTGRVFKLLLRGRSFGTGQPAITVADAIEITEFLNKDLKLSNYPNTRNDGQIPTNKVLSTDALGNLKLYSIATAPAPYIQELIPDSYLPSTRGNIRILGSFFTPKMCDRVNNPNAIVLGGVTTIHYATFVNQGEILINVTTGATEGSFPLTLDNGLSTTKNNALSIVLGTIYKPTANDWINVNAQLDIASGDNAKLINYGLEGIGTWNKNFDYTKNFAIRFIYAESPLGTFYEGSYVVTAHLVNALDDSWVMTFGTLRQTYALRTRFTYSESSETYAGSQCSVELGMGNEVKTHVLEYRWYNGIAYLYADNILRVALTKTLTQNVRLKIKTAYQDILSIKYIELA